MRLGNDIVDLSATAEHNPRFIQRILHPDEHARHPDIDLADPRLWAYWAAKEAAYKAIKQTRDIPFHHREFIVDADFKSIRYHEETLSLIVTREPIFIVATDGDISRCHSRIHSFQTEVHPDEHSRKARELLLELASEHLLIPRGELGIGRVGRIPRLLFRQKILPHPVSLTHHGRFVAASLAVVLQS